MAALFAFVFFCMSVSLLPLKASALQFSPTPSDGHVIYACAHSDVDMAWKFTKAPGDIIRSISWTFQGNSDEMLALFSQGNFVPLPSYSHRVRFVPNAGIILSTVTTSDSGNYSILVVGHDTSGYAIEEQRTIWLQVSDSLSTEDHDLHAVQLPEAEFDNVSGQFHAVLSCGVFTYPADPPVSVQWLTPDGLTLPSTVYSQGRFKLLLQNPVTSGKYACMISNDSLEASCSHGKQASVTVDGLVTRMILMEAREARMEARMAQKDAVVHQLQDQSAEKDAKMHQMNITQQSLQDQLAEKDAKMHQMNITQQSLQDQLTSTRQSLMAENAGLKNELQKVKDQIPAPVAFTAQFSSTHQLSGGTTLVLDDVLLNEGQAYSPSTGRFTAPCNGTFHFTAFAEADTSSQYASLVLRTNSAAHTANSGRLFASHSYNEGHGQTGSVQVTVHLLHAESVWVEAWTNSHFYGGVYTGFSGFLLSVTGSR